MVICIGGLALLVASDLLTGKNGEAKRKGEGDGFMLIASTLFGFSKYRFTPNLPVVITSR